MSSRTTHGGALTHRDEATAASSRVVPLRLPAVSGATRSTTTPLGTTRPRLASRLARGAADGSSFAAFALGLSAATLLCGLSWSFVVLASASAGPLDGALVMLAFALGTVPATLSVAGLAQGPLQRVLRWMERRWSPQVAAQVGPKLAAIVLLVLGLVTLSGRVARVPSEVHVASDGRLVGAHVDDTCHPPEPLP